MTDASLDTAKKICIVKADRIGDLVLVSGYLAFLAESLPDAEIDLHVAPDMAGLGELLHPRINTIALPFSRHLDVPDNSLAGWLWDIDHRDYDALLVPRFTLAEPEVLSLRYLSIPQRHGFVNFENPIPEDWLTLRLGPAKRDMEAALDGPEVDAWSHEVDKYAELARWQGFDVEVADLEPALYLDGEPISTSARRRDLLVWPGASEPLKRWPVERFTELVEQLDRKEEALTIGGTPAEEPIVDGLVEHLADEDPQRWICDPDDLERTVRRLSKFRAVIANDTGIAHLAAAAGCRVISISSAVHEDRFTVRGNKSTTVFADVPCRRCKGDCIFDEPVWPCVTEIRAEEIADRVSLSKRPPVKLTVSAPTFEEDPQALLASVSSLNARTTLNRKREQAQLHFSRMIADDLRRRAESEVEKLEEERQQAQQRLADLERQAEKTASLQAELEKTAAACEHEREKAAAVEAQLAEITQTKEQALAREQGLHEQLQRLTDSVARTSDQLARLDEERQRVARERQEEATRLGELQERLQRAEQSARELQAALEERERQTAEVVEQLSRSEETREELATQLSELAEDKRQLQREFDELVASAGELAARVNELETAVQDAEATVRQRLGELEHLRAARRATAERLRAARRRQREHAAWSAAFIHAGFRPAPRRHTWLGPPAPAPEHPRISIVTPSFNTAQFIEATIQSVLEQDYPDFEHIVLDAASGDGTIEICARYPHLRWVVEKDHGQAHAINRGLLMSTGDIVAYLNSDDVYRPGAFQAVADYFRDHPDCMVLVGDCDLINEAGDTVGHWQAKAGRWVDRVRYWGWEKTHCIPQQSLFFRRELLTRIGLFDADLHMVMDLDMWLRATREHELGVMDRTLSGFRLVEGTKTISRTHEMYVEQLQICRRHAEYLPLGQWLTTEIGARRHFANMMLKMSEHYIFNAEKRRLPLGLLMNGVREWPVLLLNPRTYMTAAQCVTRKSPLWPAVAQPHRAYLGVIWRLQNARRRDPTGT